MKTEDMKTKDMTTEDMKTGIPPSSNNKTLIIFRWKSHLMPSYVTEVH